MAPKKKKARLEYNEVSSTQPHFPPNLLLNGDVRTGGRVLHFLFSFLRTTHKISNVVSKQHSTVTYALDLSDTPRRTVNETETGKKEPKGTYLSMYLFLMRSASLIGSPDSDAYVSAKVKPRRMCDSKRNAELNRPCITD